MIYVEAGEEKSVLARFEEGLRHAGLGAVVAEVSRLSMIASRGLQLAAEASGTIDCRNDAMASQRIALNTSASAGGRPRSMAA